MKLKWQLCLSVATAHDQTELSEPVIGRDASFKTSHADCSSDQLLSDGGITPLNIEEADLS